jgi:predicted enzyme related to lactoylglutathione lyase
MISGGNATIVVKDMDAAIRFYTDILGLKLTNRFGDDWATVSTGDGFTIGLHPASPQYPDPGTKGSIMLGLDIDIPVDKAVAHLVKHGVAIKGEVVRSEAGNFVHIEDPDGTYIYLWEKTIGATQETELAALPE